MVPGTCIVSMFAKPLAYKSGKMVIGETQYNQQDVPSATPTPYAIVASVASSNAQSMEEDLKNMYINEQRPPSQNENTTKTHTHNL